MNTYNLRKLQEFRSDLNKINSELKKMEEQDDSSHSVGYAIIHLDSAIFHLKGSIDCAKIINNIGEESLIDDITVRTLKALQL